MLYEQISSIRNLSQIRDNKVFNIDGKHIMGSDVKEAIQEVSDSFLKQGSSHNELNVYTSKVNAIVAKVDSIDEVPEKLIRYAKENDLMIYLLGSN